MQHIYINMYHTVDFLVWLCE